MGVAKKVNTVFSSSIHSGADLLPRNTPDTSPPTEELELLQTELIELHLHSLERGKGKANAVERAKRNFA
jgi:hypothetical protein